MAELQEIEEHNYLHEAQSTERVDSHQHDDPGHDNISLVTGESGAVLSDHDPLASPNLSREDRECRSNLRLLLAQVYLLHCGVLQNMVCGADAISRNGSENKSEREKRRLERAKNYEKMHELAMDANVYAEKEKNRDMKGRSEFWLGRSCGGKDDDEAAEQHFRTAKRLHTSYASRLPIEEASIDELISYCTNRLDKRRERSEKLNKRASQQMEKQGITSDVCMVQESSLGPVWLFDHERNVERARGDLEQNMEYANGYFKNHPLPVAAAPRSISRVLKPKLHAEKVVAQAGKSIPQAEKPAFRADNLFSLSSKLPQVPGPFSNFSSHFGSQVQRPSSPVPQPGSPAPHTSSSTSKSSPQISHSEQQPPQSVTWGDQPIPSRIAETATEERPKMLLLRKTSSFRRKPSLARRDTQRSGRSLMRTDSDAPSLRSRSILGRRDTRGSSRSFRTYKWDTSSTSPERINLDAEISKLDGGWDGYGEDEDWTDEDGEVEGVVEDMKEAELLRDQS